MQYPDVDLVLIADIEENVNCRVCLDRGDPSGYMCLPCNCAGSIAYIHPECLREWIKASGSVECEICHSLYKQRWTIWAYENNLIQQNAENQPQIQEVPQEIGTSWKTGFLVCILAGILLNMILLSVQSRIIPEEVIQVLEVIFRLLLLSATMSGVIYISWIRRNTRLNIIERHE